MRKTIQLHLSLMLVLLLSGPVAYAQSLDEAEALMESRQFYVATSVLSEIIDEQTLDDNAKARAHLLRGLASMNRLRFTDAYADFDQAFTLNPGSAESQHWLGVAERYGYNGNRNNAKARALLEDASAAGIAEADYELALLLLSLDSTDESAITTLIRGAERQEPRALIALARAYEAGQFVPQDTERAFYWYQQAADIGLPEAQFKVSNAYRHGIGVEVDEDKAAEFLQLALESGYWEAEFAFGYNFEDEQDWSQVNYYYWRAAESDHMPAKINLGLGYMTGDRGLRQDFRMALHWLNQARGTILGAHYVGLLLDGGLGTSEDSVAAFALLEPISDRMPETKALTAMMIGAGRGTDPDPARAAALFAELEQHETADDLGRIASVLATHKDPAARQPELALRLALKAVDLSPTLVHIDTLAKAYAANGDFDLAAQRLEQAIALADNETDESKEMLNQRLAAYSNGQARIDGPVDLYEYDAPVEATSTVRAKFTGEVVRLFQRNNQNDPRGFDTELTDTQFGLQILVQSVEEGSLPHFMTEFAVFYIHSPTEFFARLPQNIGALRAPVGPFQFTLTEIAANGWSYDLSIEPL